MSWKKISPSARGKVNPRGKAGRNPRANSSAGKQKATQEGTFGSTAKLARRLKDAGDDFERRLEETGGEV